MSAGHPCLRVRAALPHFFRESDQASDYGSGAPDSRLARSIALARCLGALLDQRRAAADLVLDIGRRYLTRSGGPPHTVQVKMHVFTAGGKCLREVLAHFRPAIQGHTVELDKPFLLALVTRNWLIATDPIADPLFFAKQHCFTCATSCMAVLMPHHHEAIPGRDGQRLLVDVPLRDGFIRRFTTPQPAAARAGSPAGPKSVSSAPSTPTSACSA